MIENILSLNTCHMPNSNPDFHKGTLESLMPRVVTHEYGYIVFVSSMVLCAEWLNPMMKKALDNQCTVILFDNIVPRTDDFKTYDW